MSTEKQRKEFLKQLLEVETELLEKMESDNQKQDIGSKEILLCQRWKVDRLRNRLEEKKEPCGNC